MNAEQYIIQLTARKKISLREKILVYDAFQAGVSNQRIKILQRKLFRFIRIKPKFNHIITINDIIETICTCRNVNPDIICMKSRKREIVETRQICHYFAKMKTNHSNAFIGALIGRKDHATVIHSTKKVNNIIDTNKNFKEEIERINRILELKF